LALSTPYACIIARIAVLSLPRSARTTALVASFAIALVGVVAGAVRLLPWLLDPAVPWRVAAPFARGLGAVALEAALLVGWPVGWALACARFVESGEARVLLTLGERPARTAGRLGAHGAALGCALAAVSLVYGSDATAPGKVATELVEQARVSCAKADAPVTYAIPFTSMTWLCAPGREPRLVGEAPGSMRGAALTASGARIAGDFRGIELDDARLLLPGQTPVAVHVASMSLRGMAPWARASTLPAWLRALLLAVTAGAAASLAAYLVLLRAVRARAMALVLGAAGPLAALGGLRLLERADASPALFALLPAVACAACAGLEGLTRTWSRLRRRVRAAST
jgi:hypothetical protein